MYQSQQGKAFFVLLIFLSIISCKEDTKEQSYNLTYLNQNWEFSKAGSNDWMPATVPGCIYTDLMEQTIIPDPFYSDNEKLVQWVGEENWEYRTSFNVDTGLLNQGHIKLVFQGLDTYSEVFLNENKIGETNNMFREWEFDIKKHLVSGKNILQILFRSPVPYNEKWAKKSPYRLPDNRVYTRKAPYQFGWDWGPKLITCGIWKDVYIKSSNNFYIDEIRINTIKITEEVAELYADIQLFASKPESLTVEIFDMNSNDCISTYATEVKQGNNQFAWNLSIEDPVLWWPNGMGDQHLYPLKVKISSENFYTDSILNIGLRTIDLIRNNDSVGVGFVFRVNGKDVFMKGANYIPQDNFPPRVGKDKYSELIKNAKAANMNMLRVWGGGFYENDVFYDLCDQHGILIWQDFMYACAMYPGDLDFLNNISAEAIDAIKRLRNHPCLALWCGNNEVDNGWKDWGWQKALRYSKADSATIYSHYKKVFNEILPKLVEEHDGKTDYWPSSPEYGWGHEECNTHGDSHYWGVWWGKEPFEMYEAKTGRFMSEYGFQAYPDFKTVQSFCSETDLFLFSDPLKNHQKHPIGNETILEYMEREYPVPDSIFEFSYVSQLLQSQGIRTGIEAHRRSKPHCQGTLYWQLNDCWPVVSWSSVDYYGRWKALHYSVRDLFKNFMISVDQKDSILNCYIVSDSLEEVKADFSVELIDFSGTTYFENDFELLIERNSSRIVASYNLNEILHDTLIRNSFLKISLKEGRHVLAKYLHYFDIPKNLQLPEPAIRMSVKKAKRGYMIKLQSDQLVKNLCLFADRAIGHFSDNYFDLLPGLNKSILFLTDDEIESPLQEFKFIHLQLVN